MLGSTHGLSTILGSTRGLSAILGRRGWRLHLKPHRVIRELELTQHALRVLVAVALLISSLGVGRQVARHEGERRAVQPECERYRPLMRERVGPRAADDAKGS